MDKKLISFNLMKTRKVKKSNFKLRTVITAGLITLAFLVYRFDLLNIF